jgi:hypothetical protein
VIVLVPRRNPLAALTAIVSVASPPETATGAPKVVLPSENVTLPVTIPVVVEVTDATSSVVPASVTTAGTAVSDVEVTAEPVTDTVALLVEIPKVAFPP